MVRNILYAFGPKQELTPGAEITWPFDGRPAFVEISENGTLSVTGPLADFPMVGLMVVHHTVAGTSLTLSGDSSNVVWSTGAGQHTILEFTWDGTEYVWTSRTKSSVAALTQLSTPGSFAAVASGTNINLSWTDVLNESSYLIEVSDTGTGGWSTLTAPAAGATSYTHAVGTNDTQKFYRLKAVGNGTTYSDSAYATANATTGAAATLSSAYISSAQAAGGTLSTAEQTALSDFETTINTIGSSKFKQILLYAGGTAGSAVIDFMGNQNASLVGSPSVSALGVLLNGTSQYINTGLIPANWLASAFNMGMTRKVKDNVAADDRTGVYQETGGAFMGINLNVDISTSYVVAGNISVAPSINNPTNFSLPITASRVSATEMYAYVDGANYPYLTDATTAIPEGLATIPIYDGAMNFNGTANYFTANTAQFFAVHEGLTLSEVQAFTTAIDNLMTALGR